MTEESLNEILFRINKSSEELILKMSKLLQNFKIESDWEGNFLEVSDILEGIKERLNELDKDFIYNSALVFGRAQAIISILMLSQKGKK